MNIKEIIWYFNNINGKGKKIETHKKLKMVDDMNIEIL